MAQERKLLENEEKIQFLQQLSSQQIASAMYQQAAPKAERLRRIAEYEKEIEQAWHKIAELEQIRKRP